MSLAVTRAATMISTHERVPPTHLSPLSCFPLKFVSLRLLHCNRGRIAVAWQPPQVEEHGLQLDATGESPPPRAPSRASRPRARWRPAR
jgi:hypothetical protein